MDKFDMCTALREWQEEITERVERETTVRVKRETTDEYIENLILTEGFDVEGALRALRVPAEKWDEYQKHLQCEKDD